MTATEPTLTFQQKTRHPRSYGAAFSVFRHEPRLQDEVDARAAYGGPQRQLHVTLDREIAPAV